MNPRKRVDFGLLSSSNLPSNDTAKGLVEGLAEVHRAYGVPECVLYYWTFPQPVPNSARVFIVHKYFSSSSLM
ncbi:hypothetical protein BGY98DRAFT_994720 [Russula aff. rugulosa BPL654]|nr:hypothetical protein BGY98DRAFT_994720 [Russula aff. rugulosa BPL654]